MISEKDIDTFIELTEFFRQHEAALQKVLKENPVIPCGKEGEKDSRISVQEILAGWIDNLAGGSFLNDRLEKLANLLITSGLGGKIEELKKEIRELKSQLAEKPAPVPVPPPVEEVEKPITDDEVRAMCKRICNELGLRLNRSIDGKVNYVIAHEDEESNLVRHFGVEDRGQLESAIKRFFRIDLVASQVLKKAGISLANKDQRNIARKLAKENIDGKITDAEAIKIIKAAAELLQIAKEEGFGVRTVGSEQIFIEDVYGLAKNYGLAEVMQADTEREKARRHFRESVEGFKKFEREVT